MAFGISFGSKKTTTDQQTAMTKAEDTKSSGTTSQNQTQTGTTTGSTSQTGQTAQQGATKASSTNATATTGTQATTQTSKSFSDAILGALEQSTANALNSAAQSQGPSAESLNGFDKNAYVANGMAGATADANANLESSINGLFDSSGATASGNSMVALLADRLRGDNAANLAGINAQLTGQAEQINRENVLAGVQVDQNNQGFAAQLLAALKGGVSSTTGEAQTTEATQGNQQQIGQSAESGSSSQQQQTQQDTTQVLASVIQQLLSSKTNTTGTENTHGTSKSGGFGLSLGI